MTSRVSTTTPVVVVTADSHVGPPLGDLRPYCGKKYLRAFDEEVAAYAANPDTAYRWDVRNPDLLRYFGGDEKALSEILAGLMRNAEGAGIRDVTTRLADLDQDGVAGEVIFHGTPDASGVFTPLPFVAKEAELAAEGRRIYNRWLADFCSVAPERHVGLCEIPIWDLEASVEAVRWAAAHGLRGVSFPQPQSSRPPYEDPAWDPFFAVCADLRMPLVTHVGGGEWGPAYSGPAATAIMVVESISASGRNVWHMIFAGVFDRHPSLTLAITEVPGTWFANAIRDMESVYSERLYFAGEPLRRSLKKRPRDYVKSNVFFGCSFMSRTEAETTVALDLTDRVMWGSDYPHPEGTWMYSPDASGQRPSVTRLSLANTFAGFDEASVRRMVGGNAIACYCLDANALEKVAERIGPSVEELTTAPDLGRLPPEYVGLGFRTGSGTWT